MTEFDYSREFWEGLPRFVIIEGSDGAGKSTLVEGLVTWMRDVLQLDVEQLREPGSGAIAARIRELLLFATDENISTYEEILLMTTARVDTRLKHAQPALAAGKWVVCDRGELSSIVYQGFARHQQHLVLAGAGFQPDDFQCRKCLKRSKPLSASAASGMAFGSAGMTSKKFFAGRVASWFWKYMLVFSKALPPQNLPFKSSAASQSTWWEIASLRQLRRTSVRP